MTTTTQTFLDGNFAPVTEEVTTATCPSPAASRPSWPAACCASGPTR